MSKPEPAYALSVKLNSKRLRKLYPNASYKNAWHTLKRMLSARGFTHDGKLFVGTSKHSPTDCIEAVLHLRKKLKWFWGSVSTLRMLRVEEPVDLLKALKEVNL